MDRPEARTILLSEDLMPKILQQVAASDAARVRLLPYSLLVSCDPVA